jgi:glycerophosphoryl diester phosphodiesterase
VQTDRQLSQTSTVGAYNPLMPGDGRIQLLVIAAIVVSSSLATRTADGAKQAIAHRGASSYAPEHTAAAYRLALEQKADYVEQDLAVTRDGVLICLHDDTLERTSNVASVFPDRSTNKRWVANDFTLAEIRRLDMGAWFGPKFAGEKVVTWQEAIDLVRGKAGLYPELKSPPLYTGRGVDMVKLFIESVKKNGLDLPTSLAATPIIVQSFDEPTVRRLARELPTVPRVFLMESFGDGMSDARLRDIKSFATGIGPAKALLLAQPDVVKRAQAVGLTVTAYTFRSRNTGMFPSVRDEMSHFVHTLGIDAVFTDNPDQFPRP